jgi:ubiquinone/menaquinone biosynthesis C-methylase UbiE
MKSPDYSPYAKKYAQSRPRYPDELFKYLVSLVEQHMVAWDCATGSGQAALSLVNYFKKVIATDISSEQISNAVRHNRIEYRVCQAEKSGISNNSVNLITVASAVHWFDLNNFYREVQRVITPGGILAVWTYHVGYVEPPFDKLFLNFYNQILAPYFSKGAKLVDKKYSTISLPGKQIKVKDFFVSAKWNLSNMLNFIESWSGTQHYKKEKGENPVDLIYPELKQLWGESEKINTIRWPLFIKISRL